MTTERPDTVNVFNIALGLCFVALGVALLLERSDVIEMRQIARLWPLALVVLGGAVMWQASRGGGSVSDPGWGWLVWVVLGGLLFSYAFDRRADGPGAGRWANGFAILSADRRPAFEGDFHGGSTTSLLGGVDLDLRGASVEPGRTVVLDVFNVLGGTEIRVPDHWRVSVETVTILGGVSDQRRREPRPEGESSDPSSTTDETSDAASSGVAASPADPAVLADPPRLVIRGIVFLGGVSVKR